MVVSASRRTDLPAFYSEWLMNRIREGEVRVRNPLNPHQVRRVSLDPAEVQAIVFWTRDPRPLLSRLPELERRGFFYYFLFTVTPYGPDLERSLPPREERLAAFAALADRIGPARVLWRYDPVLVTDRLDPGFHRRSFERLAARLEGYTGRCIVSFLTLYAKSRRNLGGLPLRTPDPQERSALVGFFRDTAAGRGMALQTCALEAASGGAAPDGGEPGGCIDGRLITRLTGRPTPGGRDRSQRPLCRCTPSVDIGAYDTCLHGCRYCYATRGEEAARRNREAHDPASPLLVS